MAPRRDNPDAELRGEPLHSIELRSVSGEQQPWAQRGIEPRERAQQEVDTFLQRVDAADIEHIVAGSDLGFEKARVQAVRDDAEARVRRMLLQVLAHSLRQHDEMHVASCQAPLAPHKWQPIALLQLGRQEPLHGTNDRTARDKRREGRAERRHEVLDQQVVREVAERARRGKEERDVVRRTVVADAPSQAHVAHTFTH